MKEIDAHAPEMPTRFAKQLTQVVRSAVAIGMGRAEAMHLALRCARDSMPPMRLAVSSSYSDESGAHIPFVRHEVRRSADIWA